MVTKMYLTAYNVAQSLVWSAALVLSVRSIVENGGSLTSVYDDAGWFVRLGQCSAVMEVLHSLLGLVRSPVLTALMQWREDARYHGRHTPHRVVARDDGGGIDVFGVVPVGGHTLPVVRPGEHSRLAQLVEILRVHPSHPIGGSAEILLMYHSLPTIDARVPYTFSMPNAFNAAFYYPWFLRGLLYVYPFSY